VNPPQGPGRNWEVGDANQLIAEGLTNRSFSRGKELYEALLCQNCHVMGDQGGNVGPNLTNLGTRASTWDILQSLQTPSLAISDQYAATLYSLEDGSSIMGRTLRSSEDTLWVNVNPYQPEEAQAIAKNQVKDQQPAAVSLMPGGLINQLNAEELLDFMAYLKSGGDQNFEAFKP
jgi:putative heme-binding domain-containing protein